MPEFVMPDTGAIIAALSSTPLALPQSDKGRFFNLTWWPAHHKEIEGPVVKAIERTDDNSFDRRVNIMRIVERIDAKNGGQLAELGFSPSEITTYATRAVNKRIRPYGFVIRNQKLTPLALTHQAA